MIGNIVGFLVLILVTLLFIWLLIRSLRSQHKILKWFGVFFTGVFSLLFLAVTALTALGMSRVYLPRPVPAVSITVASTPEKIARGQHLAEVLCRDCHTDNKQLPLSGSHTNLIAGTGLPLGSMYAANLTPGGYIGSWTDAQLFQALRYNVLPDGKTLFMPAQGVRLLNDDDAEAMIAFLRSQPAVQYNPPAPQPTLLSVMMIGAGLIDVTPQLRPGPVQAIPKAPTVEYGKYVIGIMGCADCHGKDLRGGQPPAPRGPNLAVVKGWTQEQFVTAIRTGMLPEGQQLSDVMPWKFYGGMDDTELQAAYMYLRGLPAK